MYRPMTAQQHQQLIDLACVPEMARKLIERIEANPRARDALWDVLSIAQLTIAAA